jgi:penicillin-insensitive murein endopeptidase
MESVLQQIVRLAGVIMTDPKPDPLRPTQDSRGFFMLPRAARDVGYYTYGTMDKRPDRGGYQYAHPIMMTAILRVAHEWQKIDPRRVGVGNISRADMRDDGEHATHLDGLQVDLRPIRKDGVECPVSCFSPEYDRAATTKIIELFRAFTPVQVVWFNDMSIPFVRPMRGHHDHFHVGLRG